MGRPKGSKNKRDDSTAVQEPVVSEERHEAPVGVRRPVHGDMPNVPDGPREVEDEGAGSGEGEGDRAASARSGNSSEDEAGPEDVYLGGLITVSIEVASAQLQRLRNTVEKAGQIIQARITSEQSSTCAYCGKVIVDHAKAFSRMTNRNPRTGVLVTLAGPILSALGVPSFITKGIGAILPVLAAAKQQKTT